MSRPAPTPVSVPLLLPPVDLRREHAPEPLRVEGTLPAGLRGTLYRNGPARFDAAADHWFDGIGAVTALRFADGAATGAVRLVGGAATPGMARYRHPASVANRLRTIFGGPGIANLANINVLAWRDRLFALYEGAPATELDPATLERRGEPDFGGQAPIVHAHHHRVPARKATFAVGLRNGRVAEIDLVAFPDEGPVRRIASIPVPGLGEIHDFFVTERHAVLLLAPLWAGLFDFLGTGSFERGLRWRPELGTEVVVIPLDAPDRVVRFATDPFFWWHQANAWDDGDRIVVSYVRYPDFGVSDWLDRLHHAVPSDAPNGSQLWRATIDPAARTFRAELVLDAGVEFPWVADDRVGRRHRYTWMAAQAPESARRGWYTRLVRHDGETGHVAWVDPGAGRAIGEPVVVSHGPDELDAWVLAMVREPGAAHLAVFDARRAEDGPVARVHFDGPVPHTLHGTFVRAS